MFLYMFIPKLEKPYQLINFLFQINSENILKCDYGENGDNSFTVSFLVILRFVYN